MNKSKKIISLLLSFVMLLGITAGFGLSTYADDVNNYEEITGEKFLCGDYEYAKNYVDVFWKDDDDGPEKGYGIFDGTVSISRYNGMESEIIIPTELDGYPVTNFYAYAFSEDQNLKSISLPDGFTKITRDAFHNCHTLMSISIPDSVKEIDSLAFQSCYNLKSVTLPKNLEEIGYCTFNACKSLEKILIPSSVESIGQWAFAGCDLLKDFIVLNSDCYIFPIDTIPDTATIYGYSNSTAQEYAESNNIKFVALDKNSIIEDGTDTEYKIGTESGASIHCAYPLDEFVNVSINGKIVDKSNYTLKDGSTILTFKPEYLNTLKAGEYTVSLNYSIGTVETSLTVSENHSQTETPTEQPTKPVVENPTKPAEEKPTVAPTKPSDDVTEPTTNNTVVTSNITSNNTTNATKGNQSSPDTGNNLYLTPMIFLAVSSAFVLVLMVAKTSKKKKITE